MGVLVIAEAGVNHNGNVDTAIKLCDAAKKAGCDVVKFQTWQTDLLLTREVGQAEYQTENTGVTQSQYEMLKELELSYDDFRKIKSHCDDIGIQFASTADEPVSLDFLMSLGIPFIKIGSGEIGNIPYLRYMGSKGLPVILSTGMSTIDDVEISLKALREGGAKDIKLLHCTTSYPCPIDSVNLLAMNTLRDKFGLEVGYSDHTQGITVPIAAVTLGATVIEKHFTLDRNMQGPDHAASTEPGEFADMIRQIRLVEKALGTGEKIPTDAEREISKVVTKRIVASKFINAGDTYTESNVCVKRSNSGVLARCWDEVIGQKAVKNISVDEGIVL